jgi:hypothetical protein
MPFIAHDSEPVKIKLNFVPGPGNFGGKPKDDVIDMTPPANPYQDAAPNLDLRAIEAPRRRWETAAGIVEEPRPHPFDADVQPKRAPESPGAHDHLPKWHSPSWESIRPSNVDHGPRYGAFGPPNPPKNGWMK